MVCCLINDSVDTILSISVNNIWFVVKSTTQWTLFCLFQSITYGLLSNQRLSGHYFVYFSQYYIPGRVAQSVTCLDTDACLTADPGVASSIPARSHTFVEIDHEIISTVILLPSADSFKKGCCQLQAKVCAQITG